MHGDLSHHLRSRLYALGLNGVLEQSVKLSANGFARDRYVIGIASAAVDERRLAAVMAYCNPPYSVAESILRRLPEASTLGVGQDGSWEEGSRRLYMEYWHRLQADAIADQANRKSDETGPLLTVGARRFSGVHVMDAWKWQASRVGEWYQSRYYVFPDLNREETFAVFAHHVRKNLVSGSVATGLISILANLKGHKDRNACAQLWSAWDLDQNNRLQARQTLDLSILDFEMPLDCLHSVSSEMCVEFPAAADQWRRWLGRTAATNAIISHLATGIDRVGQPYCCIYYLDEQR